MTDDPIIGAVRAVLELGWPAIVLVQSAILWRKVEALNERYLTFLEAQVEGKKAQETPERTQPEALTS